MTKDDLQQIIDAAVPAIKRYVTEALDERERKLKKQFDELGDIFAEATGKSIRDCLDEELGGIIKRIDQLAARPVMLFKGIWDADLEYERGHVVTDAGSLWCCVDKTKRQRPGKSADWKLVAKAGSAQSNG